jgi:hypothetical protein
MTLRQTQCELSAALNDDEWRRANHRLSNCHPSTAHELVRLGLVGCHARERKGASGSSHAGDSCRSQTRHVMRWQARASLAAFPKAIGAVTRPGSFFR